MVEPISLAAMAAPAVIQGIQSFRNANAARNLKRSNYIPPALEEAIKAARLNTNATRYAGQDRDEANVKNAGANALATGKANARSANDLISLTGKVNATSNNAYQNMGQRFGLWKNSQVGSLQRFMAQKAGIQQQHDRDFSASKASLKGSSMLNLYNAGSNLSSMAILGNEYGLFDKKAPTTSPYQTIMDQVGKSNAWMSGYRSSLNKHGQIGK